MFKKFTKTFIIIMASISLLLSSFMISPIVANAKSKDKGHHIPIPTHKTNRERQSVFNIFSEVAKIVGVDEQTIIVKVESGMTFKAIAESYYISESTLLDKLEDRAEEDINQALKDGTITETQSLNMKRYSVSMLKLLVSNKYSSTSNLSRPPEGITAISKNKSQIYLNWSLVSNATSYHIYRATSYSGSYKKVGTTKKTSYTDKRLRTGMTYYYKVQAVNRIEKSPFSSIVNVTVGSSLNGLNIPTGIIAKASSDTQISLQWNAVPKATNYSIYRSTIYSENYSKIATTNTTNFIDNNLAADTTYYYKIKAYNTSYTSDYSAVVSATTDYKYNRYLDAPDDLEIRYVSESEIILQWDKVDDAEIYYIYRSTSKTGTFSIVAAVNDTDYTDYSLKADTTYYYKIQAYDNGYASEYSSVVHATTDRN